MNIKIHPVTLGVDHCYLLQGDGLIFIDGGAPNQAKRFVRALEKLSIRPRDTGLIVITHGHWDHIGSARGIKELTGAPIALHRREKDWLEKSLKPMPPGVTPWGRTLISIMSTYVSAVHIPTTSVDIVLDDAGLSLAEYGIPGQIIYTPGHSMGSVSVLLEDGSAFVGDLAMNGFPLRSTPGLPIFAENMQKVKESWKILLDKGINTIYPGHGEPFSVNVIRKVICG